MKRQILTNIGMRMEAIKVYRYEYCKVNGEFDLESRETSLTATESDTEDLRTQRNLISEEGYSKRLSMGIISWNKQGDRIITSKYGAKYNTME
jgi:hypothetical protein